MIGLILGDTDFSEIVLNKIKKLKKKYSFNEMAILVRAIFQTREFEERFLGGNNGSRRDFSRWYCL